MEQRQRVTAQGAMPYAYDTGTNQVNNMFKKYTAYTVIRADGVRELLSIERMHATVAWAATGYESLIDIDRVLQEACKNVFDGITDRQIADALILATSVFVESDPAYGYVAGRLLFKKLYAEATGTSTAHSDIDAVYRQHFVDTIKFGVENNIFDRRVLEFDLDRLAQALVPERDDLFDYMGLHTLYQRYFVRHKKRRMELPQAFWMRVAMGLALQEPEKEKYAIKFYNLMSQMRYVPSTPTLLHAALTRPQLSSCYLTTVTDDLVHIFKCFGDNAQMAKWSGGVANDWTNIRSTGAIVKAINAESQGLIPFLKIANDVTAAINRSGNRRGACCMYLETWHMDIEDFIDLRKNTGDERRRTHDINTANWIPDLFMKRVQQDAEWTLFSPHEVPDLHDLYGSAFEKRYEEYERMAERGEIEMTRKISAKQLWRKMLSRLFETGHPWITFKDPCNVRSPQDHVGVVHSSNLCTEITLNTSAEETAVCNLGSINLAKHVVEAEVNDQMLADTVTLAVRMLDNVIDINFYPTQEGKTSNLRHRPIGFGQMGLQDAMYKLDIAFDNERALNFNNEIQEKLAYYAILASSKLAQERGAYPSYKGSKWARGIFPQDTIALLEKERSQKIEALPSGKLDWNPVRAHVREYGMRNSNVMAVAPTATISTIAGCFPCIEPIYKNIYVKSNMSGEFTVVNKFLHADLKKLGLWDQNMLDELKYYDGSVQHIERIPQHFKDKYKEAFEIDPIWLIKLTAARGQWIDQSQSHNVFMKGVSGKKLDEIYMTAWQYGLKTTYYLRTLAASQIEKSTLDAKKFGFTQKRTYATNDVAMSINTVEEDNMVTTGQTCSISADPECDVCQ
ncbi:MAG TPA: ribonucleoside-diphosphate reductase subunit alpha [Candidatus Dependentiae bacterium]|nr:ribonucleoside-diphosphate reductase subunit alpha [Candidatus Dependentiae bacterium]HRQ62837.1 ribonucleoside-diphosphate reductase subunit alpha [Candidatus Dependentiae bacterium]